MVIEFYSEYYVSDFHNVDLAQQFATCIEHGQYCRVAATDFVYNLVQLHIGLNTQIVALNHRVEIHQCQHGVVGMVGKQFSLLGQARTIDAVRLENADGHIGHYAHNHQRHKHRVATGKLGNQEYTRKRGMHHARHHTCHTQQREVLFGHIHTYLVNVPKARKEEAGKAADKQRWCECSTAAASAIGGRCGYYLGKQYQGDIYQQQRPLTREHRVVEYAVPVVGILSVQQQVNTAVTLAVQRWEQENKQTKRSAADGQLYVRLILEFREHILAGTHHADKVQRNQSAGNA